jgi:YD repeat-containing protein
MPPARALGPPFGALVGQILGWPARLCARPRGLGVSAALRCLVFLTCLLIASLSWADAVCLYDPLGRLVRVIDRNGQAATYIYDPVGNILQIARQAGIRQDQTSIGSMDPPSAAQGTQVTLTSTGTNLAGASLTALPAGFSFVSSSLAVSGSQGVLTVSAGGYGRR